MELSKFAEYGLLGLVVGSVVILLFFVIKWTLSTTKEILIQAAEERKAWNNTLTDQISQSREFNNQMTEANRYQREEHKEMIAHLARLNGK